MKILKLIYFRKRIFSVCAPSLVGAYYLQPPDARAIFLQNDLLCNSTCSVTGGRITYWGVTTGKDARKKSDTFDIFVKKNLLNIYQLHIYELLKLVLKSLSGKHRESYLNSLFSFSPSRPTRSASKTLLMEPSCKRMIEKRSIRFRASKLFKALSKADVLPNNIIMKKKYKVFTINLRIPFWLIMMI